MEATADIPDDRLQKAVKALLDSIAYNIKITPDVEVAPVGSLPRFEGKARRIIKES